MNNIVDIPKVPSHIEGFDQVLNGGLPQGRVTMVYGPAGTGKTVLGMQFIYQSAINGESGLIISFEESRTALVENALSLGWDLESLERDKKVSVLDPRVEFQAIIAGDFTITGLLAMLDAKLEHTGAHRVLIDGIDVLMQITPDPMARKQELLRVHDWLLERNMTAIINTKVQSGSKETPQFPFLEYAADCVIRLIEDEEAPVPTRRLQVVKYRGSGFGRGAYPFTIVPHFGITVNPVSLWEQREEEKPLGEPITSGHPALDEFLGGGYRRRSSVLVAGPTGAGKTIMATLFAEAACKRGEKVLYISFEESQTQIVNAVASANIKLTAAGEAGLLKLITYLPETAGLETHLYHHVQVLREFRPDHMIIDSISPISRMASRRAVFEYTLRLLSLCRQMGITCMLTRQIPTFNVEDALRDVDFVSQLDTVLFLNYAEIGGEVNRTALVLKSRGSAHSNQFREYRITSQGVTFSDVYVGLGGMLTGTARQEQEAREESESLQREYQLEATRKDLERMRRMRELKAAELDSELAKKENELDIVRKKSEAMQQAKARRRQMREGTHQPSGDKEGES
ncbi:MAG: circadian clock protein KaiC [Chitinivibrionales bacterium]|nr:circadian clock protein KaiC [Chitinivibrionales bacterium]MBD3356176.1 circadian clock protein KaiC [Chitinivibrionales bacterium]